MQMIQYIKGVINGVLYVWRQETKLIFKDQGVLLFVFFLSLGYPLLYAFLYNNEVIHEVPVAVVDMNHSSFSREFVRKVDASSEVSIAYHVEDLEEAKVLMRLQKVYGVIYIPSSFHKDIQTGKQSIVSIYSDMGGLLYYKALFATCTDVSLLTNKHIKIARMGNSTNRQDEISIRPIEYSEVSLYNPQKGMASFLIPAVLMLILQQSMLLGVGLAAGTARENNRFFNMVSVNKYNNGVLKLVFGKSLAYFLIYILLSAYALMVVPKLFSLIQLADFSTLAAFVLSYLFACVFFSITMSGLVRNRETCMLLFVFTSLPLLFISGISWPRSAIPVFWEVFSWLFPSTFGINGFVRINNMGANLQDVKSEYFGLWIQALCYFLTSCWVYYHQLKLARKHILAKCKELKEKRSK